MDGERSVAYLTLDFIPGLLWVSRVLNVKQGIVDPGKRLTCILVMAAGSKDHMPETDGQCYRMEDNKQLQASRILVLDSRSSAGN